MLFGKGSDVLADEVDSRAVYGIMSESIARNAFVYVESVFFESLVLEVQESAVGVWMGLQG